MASTRVRLGDTVKDPLSGFTGVAVCRLTYINGCDRIAVQPKINKEGLLPGEVHFDEPQLKIIKRAVVVKKVSTTTGGPDKCLGVKGTSRKS